MKTEQRIRFELRDPFCISARLLPAVKCGDVWISIEYTERPAEQRGRVRFKYYIDGPNYEATGDDLQTGIGGGSIRNGMESLLSFLGACGESWKYDNGEKGENADLFPPKVAAWCAENTDELSMLQCEIEENPECCVETKYEE